MNLCDPQRNVVRAVPSKGTLKELEQEALIESGRLEELQRLSSLAKYDAFWREVAKNQRDPAVETRADVWGENPHPETGKIAPPGFNSLSIQHLPQKIDGETEHLFLAFLNGKAVGSVTARIWDDKSCGVRRMFVTPANRGMGIATRLLNSVEILARQERATHLELSCNRGNVNARQFWIRRRFVDAPELEAKPDPIRFVCMVKPL